MFARLASFSPRASGPRTRCPCGDRPGHPPCRGKGPEPLILLRARQSAWFGLVCEPSSCVTPCCFALSWSFASCDAQSRPATTLNTLKRFKCPSSKKSRKHQRRRHQPMDWCQRAPQSITHTHRPMLPGSEEMGQKPEAELSSLLTGFMRLEDFQ